MTWYRFTVDQTPSSTLEDVTERFLDGMVNARATRASRDPQFALYRSRKTEGKHLTCFAFVDPALFQSFLDENEAIECEAPPAPDVELLAGANLLA